MNPCKSSGIRKILGQKEGYIVAIRILIVDDFEPWRISVRSILKRNPQFRVIGEARDGIEAIEKAATLRPDVVLLDAKISEVEAAIKKADSNSERRRAKERKEDLMRLKRVEQIYV